MKIRILGGGWYGCHLSLALLRDGHEVQLLETATALFSGASGGNPARLHIGTHYPRSRLTRAACQENHAAFMRAYGDLTASVPINLYAIAEHDSMIDFGTYCQILKGEIEYITVERPAEFGLQRVEGAILTGERHIHIAAARAFFARELIGNVVYGAPSGLVINGGFDWTIDCTFCANDAAGIDRYEPCLTTLLEGPTDKAVTIMDGPFPSLYPWNETERLSSLTSAKFTPFARCRTHEEACDVLKHLDASTIENRARLMLDQIAVFFPGVRDYRIADHKLSIRAMPRSGADARLVDVVRVADRMLRIRAGKIDAVLLAEVLVKEALEAGK